VDVDGALPRRWRLGGVGWMLNARMASMLARALAPTGALFT
jgi:hypothetical protein